MAMYTLKGIGEISTDAFDEKITLRNLLQHFSFYDFIIVDTSPASPPLVLCLP